MKIANMRVLLSTLICLLYSNTVNANIPGLAPKSPYSFDGYVAYLGSYVDYRNYDSVVDQQIQNRLNFEYRFNSDVKFNTSMRNRILVGDTFQNELYRTHGTTDAGFMNLSHDWINSEDVVATTQFDRLYLTYKRDQLTTRVGRYRINWGMNTIWNPNDLFNPFSIYNVDYPEKSGVDALEVTYQLGFASEINAVYAPHNDSSLDSYAGRYLFNVNGIDAQVLLGKSYTDVSIGGGFASDLKGIGFKGEATYFMPTQPDWTLDSGESLEDTLVSSLEATYSFGTSLNLMSNASILYISNPIDVVQAQTIPLTARTLSHTEWTAYVDTGFDLTPLSRLTFMASYYDDSSYFVGANTTYSLGDDWSLNGFAQYFSGVIDSVGVYGQLNWYF
jgi:hypothetical protein